MDYTSILVSTEPGSVGLVKLNRPQQLNALNSVLMEELVQALETFDRDDGVHCIVITGNERAFAAGADIKEMAGASAVEMLLRDNIARWDRIRRVKKPIIAAVSGHCLGGCSISCSPLKIRKKACKPLSKNVPPSGKANSGQVQGLPLSNGTNTWQS
jgi:enoyl-CoA hydratase/carnithine racemase